MPRRDPWKASLVFVVIGLGAIVWGALLYRGYLIQHAADSLPYAVALFLIGCASLFSTMPLLIPSKKIRLTCITFLFGLALGGSVLFRVWWTNFSQPPIAGVSARDTKPLYDKIQNGLTKAQVVELLGEPAEKEAVRDRGRSSREKYEEKWRYTRGGWQFIDVYFDKKGRVAGKSFDK